MMKLLRCVFLGIYVFTGSGRLSAERGVSPPPTKSLDRSTTAKVRLVDEATGALHINGPKTWKCLGDLADLFGASSPSTKPRKIDIENKKKVVENEIEKCGTIINFSKAAVQELNSSTTSNALTPEAEKENVEVILEQLFKVSQGKAGDVHQAKNTSKHEKDETAKHNFADQGVPEIKGYFAKQIEYLQNEAASMTSTAPGEKAEGRVAKSTPAEKDSKSTEKDESLKSTEKDESLKSTESENSIKNAAAEKGIGKTRNITERMKNALKADGEACKELTKSLEAGERILESALKKLDSPEPSDAKTQKGEENYWKSLHKKWIDAAPPEADREENRAEAAKEKE